MYPLSLSFFLTGLSMSYVMALDTGGCTSQSQPNPIASTYPDYVTGTINGTLAVLPIPLVQAQQIIGPEYRIMTTAYRSLLPNFPADMYPALLEAEQEHDVQDFAIGIPDFSRSSISFPFVDLLGDNHTSFRFTPSLALSASNTLAFVGLASYGIEVHSARFDPPCDAYEYAHHNATSLNVWFIDNTPAFRTLFTAVATKSSPYPLSFFVNVTNQPIFSDPARTCDLQVRLFNTTLSAAPYNPVVVSGSIWAAREFFSAGGSEGTAWQGVWGVRVDTAFIEYNYVECENLAGYAG